MPKESCPRSCHQCVPISIARFGCSNSAPMPRGGVRFSLKKKKPFVFVLFRFFLFFFFFFFLAGLSAYPELSEGKPGLLGAITARAEAQVLRLSCIYALLDCSTKIKIEHHRAALALWNYCDRSARWIFGTSTGDKNADKILLALHRAGAVGMTRTEISERVFQRNISSDALSDALRVLRQSERAKSLKELTAGAPCERWFYVGKELRI